MIVVYSGDQDFILYEHQKYLKDVPTAVFEGTAKQLSEKHRFLPFDQTKKYKSEQILVRLDATIELVLPTISFLHNIQQAFPTCRINIEIPRHLAFLVQNGFNIVEPQTDFAVNNYYRVYDYRRSNRRIGMLLEPLVLISNRIENLLFKQYPLQGAYQPITDGFGDNILFIHDPLFPHEIAKPLFEQLSKKYTIEELHIYEPHNFQQAYEKICGAKYVIFFKSIREYIFTSSFLQKPGAIFVNREFQITDLQITDYEKDQYNSLGFVYNSTIEDVKIETILKKVEEWVYNA